MTGLEQLQTPKVKVPQSLLNWLLDEAEPSVRYFTLTQLLGRSESDGSVQEAHASIGKSGWAARILGRQKEDKYWNNPSSCYSPKWSSCVWQLMVLADLGLPPANSQVDNCIEHFFDNHNTETGGFSVTSRGSSWFQPHVCMTGNMVWALSKFGFAKEDRIRKAVEWLRSEQLEDGGWNCSTRDGGKHGSFHATIEPLWGLSEILHDTEKEAWRDSAKKASEFLLKHRIYKSDKDGSVVLYDFLKLHYPIHYRYDILHALRVLTGFGVKDDPRMDDAVSLLMEKRLPDGSWPLEAVYRGWRLPYAFHGGARTYRPEELDLITNGWGGEHTQQLEEAGKPSKWLTLQALLVLKRIGLVRLDAPY